MKILWTLLVAFVLWFLTFGLEIGNFWAKIASSAAILAALALILTEDKRELFKGELSHFLIGLLSAGALYLIFWAGKVFSSFLPFAGEQIGAVYSNRGASPLWLIGLLLFFVTGPCEEIYWRGFLQRGLMVRLGQNRGWLLASFIYSGVHIWTLNAMLMLAALIAGLFWGWIYKNTHSLWPSMVSHALWGCSSLSFPRFNNFKVQ